MKLVELLAREMSEWPEKASHAVQHEDGDVGFTYDGKPGRDKDHSDWSINALTASEKAYWLIGVAKSISTIASDHATAIVTRADWEAERAELVQKLASEGFALIGRAVEPVEDYGNIQIGDLVSVISIGGFSDCTGLSVGDIVEVTSVDNDESLKTVSGGSWGSIGYNYKFHSRPSA